MLSRLRELTAARTEFAFETTLASRTFAPWLADLAAAGYEIHILYIWLHTPELPIRRVRARVRKGGHGVPDDVDRRRYARSAANLFRLYLPLAHSWHVYDNSGRDLRVAASAKGPAQAPLIFDTMTYERLRESADA